MINDSFYKLIIACIIAANLNITHACDFKENDDKSRSIIKARSNFTQVTNDNDENKRAMLVMKREIVNTHMFNHAIKQLTDIEVEFAYTKKNEVKADEVKASEVKDEDIINAIILSRDTSGGFTVTSELLNKVYKIILYVQERKPVKVEMTF